MTRPLPGYVRIEHRLSLTHELLVRHPPEYIHKLIAAACGQMLEDAVLSGTMDITYPIYLDALQLHDDYQFMANLEEIKVRLDYKERAPERTQIDSGRRQLNG